MIYLSHIYIYNFFSQLLPTEVSVPFISLLSN